MSWAPAEDAKHPFPGFSVSELPVIGPEFRGRWVFLEALQIERPSFWRELREIERQKSPEAVASWMIRSGVTDEWFIAVILDSVEFWGKHPNSAAARLEGAKNWFYYAMAQESLLEAGTFQIPPFQPLFMDPKHPEIHPIPYTPDGQAERLDKFQRRMRREFDAQLADYLRYIRSLSGEKLQYEPHHVTWTVRAFTGESYVDIGHNNAQTGLAERPDKLVKTAVRRFAERIGLTLPSKCQ